jgi:hypothetical protein
MGSVYICPVARWQSARKSVDCGCFWCCEGGVVCWCLPELRSRPGYWRCDLSGASWFGESDDGAFLVEMTFYHTRCGC